MITTEDIITFLNDYDNPTTHFLFDIDTEGLERFIKPETNLYSLVMLSKAREQGLDLVFVDEEKFFDDVMFRIRGDLLNGQGPFEGAFYIEFQLSPVLLAGQSFSFIDHSESMGFGFMLDTMNFGNEIVNYFLKDSGFTNFGEWYDEDVKTIQQLADHINKVLSQSKTKLYLASKLPKWKGWFNLIFTAVVTVCVGMYLVFKFFRTVYRWFFASGKQVKQSTKLTTPS